MTSNPNSGWARVGWLAIVVVLVHGLMWWAAMPPWGAPDEPGHYLYVRLLADLGRRPQRTDLSPAAEKAVIASLVQHNWWAYNRRPPSQPAPVRFTGDPVLAASGVQFATEPPAFYGLMAGWLRLAPRGWTDDPALALRWLRLGALVLRLVAVAAALWLGRRVWPWRPGWGLTLALFAGTLPMVGFIGGSVNNDVLALTWGAVVFALLASAHSRRQHWLAFALAAAGPLLVKASLLFLWPLVLVLALWRWRWRRAGFLALAVLLVLLLLPNPRWAAGWRRSPEWIVSRNDAGLVLQPTNDQPATLSQIIAGKELLGMRGQPVRMNAHIGGSDNGRLRLILADDYHVTEHVCTVQPSAPCHIMFIIDPHATRLFIQAVGEHGELAFRLDLLCPGNRPCLFNGDGRSPDLLSSPLLRRVERALPVPAGFFGRALAPAAWDSPAQLRYLLFEAFTWASFWGYFGWLSRALPWPAYALLVGLSLLAGWGLFFRSLDAVRRWRQKQLNAEDRLLGLSGLTLILILGQTWLPMLGQTWQPQGRYLFPALLPIAVLCLLGWERALPLAWRPRLFLLVAIGLASFNLIALRTTIP